MQRLSDLTQLHDEMMKDPKYRRQYEAAEEAKAYEERQQHLRDLAKMVDAIGYDRLAELVQADAEGRAVVLPCKVGDEVYVHGLNQTVYAAIVTDVDITLEKVRFIYNGTSLRDHIYFGDFGKTVFLTRAAAEQAKGERE